MRFLNPSPIAWLFGAVCLVSLPAQAALYKWVDEKGETHYSDKVPPDQAKHGSQEISQGGRVLKENEGQKSEAELQAERQRKLDEQERLKQEQQRKTEDRMLLLTYQSVKEVEDARDTKIASLESTIQITSATLVDQQEKLQSLHSEAASYERNGKAVPMKVLEQIKTLQGQIRQTENYINAKKQEQAQVQNQFEVHIQRYRELTEDSKTDRP